MLGLVQLGPAWTKLSRRWSHVPKNVFPSWADWALHCVLLGRYYDITPQHLHCRHVIFLHIHTWPTRAECWCKHPFLQNIFQTWLSTSQGRKYLEKFDSSESFWDLDNSSMLQFSNSKPDVRETALVDSIQHKVSTQALTPEIVVHLAQSWKCSRTWLPRVPLLIYIYIIYGCKAFIGTLLKSDTMPRALAEFGGIPEAQGRRCTNLPESTLILPHLQT